MLTFLAWVVLAAPVALAALWVTGEYILQDRGEEGEWTSPLGVEGSLTNPVTPGGQDGGEADPTAVHG
jgi:hypothetical protein